MVKLVFQEMWFLIVPIAIVWAVLLVAFPKAMLLSYLLFVVISEVRHHRYMKLKKKEAKPYG